MVIVADNITLDRASFVDIIILNRRLFLDNIIQEVAPSNTAKIVAKSTCIARRLFVVGAAYLRDSKLSVLF